MLPVAIVGWRAFILPVQHIGVATIAILFSCAPVHTSQGLHLVFTLVALLILKISQIYLLVIFTNERICYCYYSSQVIYY